jgi:hypothetical protein
MTIRHLGIITFAVLTLTGAAGADDEAIQASITLQAPCCFENPRYTGTCEVTPGPDESCGGILAYLNNPNSMGKGYCGNTDIRGGWSEVSCPTGETSATTACTAEPPRE